MIQHYKTTYQDKNNVVTRKNNNITVLNNITKNKTTTNNITRYNTKLHQEQQYWYVVTFQYN